MLRLIGFHDFPIRSISVSVIIEQGFPMVRVLRVGPNYWTVYRKQNGSPPELDPWPKRRVMYQLGEWLEWLGCAEGEIPDRREFYSI